MYCINCGTQNDPEYKFCMKCGNALEGGAEIPMPEGETLPEPSTLDTQPTEASVQQPPYTPPIETPVQQTQYTPQTYASQPVPRPQSGPVTSTPKQITIPSFTLSTSSLSALNIWGPFAGFGARRRHIGWVMDNKGEEAQELVSMVDTKFQERQIPGVTVKKETLTARGVIVETRPYFILRRNLVSMALHITQFGKDLFISLASYLKPPISNFRVILFVLMLLFGAYTVFVFPISLSNAIDRAASSINMFGGSMSTGGLFSLLCFVGPLGTINNLALILFFIYAIYSWISERDFWKGLRVAPNEFNEDDLMAMEQAVDRTVRISLDEIGLDPDDLKPIDAVNPRRII